ncbi:OmpA family protein [Oscillatoria sp. HE19RPO]|uniref:OmpA family protein n=1 Tax=Oscillatoria sp. HE19RPO TaxID=2954806 RepID=UPI0020C35E06|nr:OmpA family protein [Oscillatoria sp. HE19RPO]
MLNFNQVPLNVEEEETDNSSFYLAIGDLMSGVLMVFALLFITTLLQLQEAKEQLSQQRRIFVGELVGHLKGNEIDVKVNEETGEVSVREAILFDEGSAQLKPEGKAELNKFIPLYSQVIFSNPDFEREISRVIIEGHTSSKGSYEANMELSLMRALAVTQYIFSEELLFASKPELTQKIMAAGRGEIEAQPEQDNPSDRKVVFRFQFRGEGIGTLD